MLVTTGAGAALAAPGYTEPPVPTPPGTPGGFSNVLTTQSFGGAGGTIGPVTSGRLRATVHVPRGDFPAGADITLTSPNLTMLGPVRGFPGFHVLGGIGVMVGFAGVKLHITFTSPLTLRVTSPLIRPGAIVIVWNGTRWVRVAASVSGGAITIPIAGDLAFLVLNPGGPGAAIGPVTVPGGRGHGHHGHHGRLFGGHHGRHHHGWVGMRYGRAALHGQHAALTAASLTADGSGTRKPDVAAIAALVAGLLVAAAGGLTYLIRRRSGARW